MPAQHIVFLSDIVEELDAAAEAGMKTVWVQRSDTPLHHERHQVVSRFDDIRLDALY